MKFFDIKTPIDLSMAKLNNNRELKIESDCQKLNIQ